MKIVPTFCEFEQMAKVGNVIPVYYETLADMETPVSAYLKTRDNTFSFLLESAELGKRWGRYSFIGWNPHLVVSVRDKDMEISRGNKQTFLRDVKNPLQVLRDINRGFHPAWETGDFHLPGGLIGYFNYDLLRKWEPVECPYEVSNFPESVFVAPQQLIIFDHLRHVIKVIALVYLEDNTDLGKAYEQAVQRIKATDSKLRSPLHQYLTEKTFRISNFVSNISKREFEAKVRRIKEYIVAGDVIQVVLSRRFSGDMSGDPFVLYRTLRSINPSPYMFYLHFDDVKLIGASPEILARLTNRKIDLRPIAGTKPRGATAKEDSTFEKELLEDPKERAEHIMLVDLGRNDVGKVAVAGSVEVSKFMEIERYSHVMHIVSHVQGILKPELDCFDLFMSVFPAGTVTGAPKVRAMQIISELEPSPRGAYAGAVGYFSFDGNMDFCITIRTIIISKNRLSVQTGAGIVYDSVPEKEYEETIGKAAGIFKAMEGAQQQ